MSTAPSSRKMLSWLVQTGTIVAELHNRCIIDTIFLFSHIFWIPFHAWQTPTLEIGKNLVDDRKQNECRGAQHMFTTDLPYSLL